MDSTYYHIGNEPQLFVDSEVIESTQGLTRRWHKPERQAGGPVIKGDRPWEDTPYFTYSNYTVLRDPRDGLIKCWYEDLGPLNAERSHPMDNSLLYAESEDGIHFCKPALDVCELNGCGTNIVMGFAKGQAATPVNPWGAIGVHSNAIVIDPYPPSPDQRFRTIFSRASRTEGHVIQCAHSPDGIHWKPYDERPSLGSSGHHLSDVSVLYYDSDARLFVQNTRHGLMYNVAFPEATPSVSNWFATYYANRPDLMNKRRVFQTRSHDFLHWSELVPISTPDDSIDNLDEAHYGMGQFKVGRMHFGLLGVFQYVDNEMEVRLLHSRDGIDFKPCDRAQPFLSPRGSGNWDAHLVSMTGAPVTMGDEWWFYHGGASCHHDWWMCGAEAIDEPESRDPEAHVQFGLGRVTLRKEGFASLDGSPQRDGFLVTKPVMSPGQRLIVNARCRPGGGIRAAILDRGNTPMAECTVEKCDAFTGDATSHIVTWGGSPEAPGANAWRKLHFVLRDAELFSYRLEAEDCGED